METLKIAALGILFALVLCFVGNVLEGLIMYLFP